MENALLMELKYHALQDGHMAMLSPSSPIMMMLPAVTNNVFRVEFRLKRQVSILILIHVIAKITSSLSGPTPLP